MKFISCSSTTVYSTPLQAATSLLPPLSPVFKQSRVLCFAALQLGHRWCGKDALKRRLQVFIDVYTPMCKVNCCIVCPSITYQSFYPHTHTHTHTHTHARTHASPSAHLLNQFPSRNAVYGSEELWLLI